MVLKIGRVRFTFQFNSTKSSPINIMVLKIGRVQVTSQIDSTKSSPFNIMVLKISRVQFTVQIDSTKSSPVELCGETYGVLLEKRLKAAAHPNFHVVRKYSQL